MAESFRVPAVGRLVARPAAVAAAVALCVAAATGSALRAAKAAGRVSPSGNAPPGAPPLVSLATVALGGFRGVAADLLWLRAGRLQEERRFVELVQLSEWITALEPESDEVWSFHAWNLAYNVTVLLGRPDDRWRWVESAVSLLRDRGLERSPGSSAVKRELGWLFLHKIGTDSDSASGFYRTAWAREIAGWLGAAGEPPAPASISAEELAGALKMDTGRMSDLEARFGRVDWRVPHASSLYWGACALEDAEGGPGELACRRMVYSSLAWMMRRDGILVGDPGDPDWTFRAAPNADLVDGTGAFIEETMEKSDFAGVRHAWVGWLRDAVAIRTAQGRLDEARRLHGRLAGFFAERGVDGVPSFEDMGTAPDEVFEDLMARAGFP